MASRRTNKIADDDLPKEFWQFMKPHLDEIGKKQKPGRKQIVDLTYKLLKYCNDDAICIRFVNFPHGTWSEKLFENLQEYVTNYIATLFEVANDLPNEELLQYIGKQWEWCHSFSKIMNYIVNSILHYSNEESRSRDIFDDKDTSKCDCAHEMFNVAWQEQFYTPCMLRVTSVMHQLIETDRHRGIGELRDVSAVINSWTELNAAFASMEDMDETSNYFEACINSYTVTCIENMTAFFKKRSMELWKSCSFVEYMQEALKAVNGEDTRIRYCFPESARDSASKLCNQIWISEHSETFLKEFQNFLSTDNHEHLEVLYKLVFRVLLVYEGFKEVLKNHITREFSNALLNAGKDASTDPKIYGKLTIDVYIKYKHLIKNSFGCDWRCRAALSEACDNFLNSDNGTESGIPSAESSELLARYCDTLLRRSKYHNDDELEAIGNQILLVFECIPNNDVFYPFYEKFLSKRLIQNASAKLEIESYVVIKLKQNYRDEATRKFHNMLQDIVVSKDLNKAYRKYSEAGKVTRKKDFGVQVLSTGSWPSEKSEQLQIFPEIEFFISSFTEFYVGRHSGRKLNWLYHLSAGELVTTCFKKRYTIQASTFQVAILLRFNYAIRYSIQQLQEDTGIQLDYLKQVVQLLLKNRLLVHEEDGKLNSESHVALFEGYKNVKSRVNIIMPLKIQQKVQKNTTCYEIQRERIMLIQAAIVHIMKMRQQCYHDDLVVEIISELSSRFSPAITMIKSCIDDLIEKEYIDRDPNKMNKYRYVA